MNISHGSRNRITGDEQVDVLLSTTGPEGETKRYDASVVRGGRLALKTILCAPSSYLSHTAVYEGNYYRFLEKNAHLFGLVILLPSLAQTIFFPAAIMTEYCVVGPYTLAKADAKRKFNNVKVSLVVSM